MGAPVRSTCARTCAPGSRSPSPPSPPWWPRRSGCSATAPPPSGSTRRSTPPCSRRPTALQNGQTDVLTDAGTRRARGPRRGPSAVGGRAGRGAGRDRHAARCLGVRLPVSGTDPGDSPPDPRPAGPTSPRADVERRDVPDPDHGAGPTARRPAGRRRGRGHRARPRGHGERDRRSPASAVLLIAAGAAGCSPGASPAASRRWPASPRTSACTAGVDRQVPVEGPTRWAGLASAFNTMLARLAAARDAQERLIQDAAHELRTPLTSLRTNASVLRRFGELSAGRPRPPASPTSRARPAS